jgi:hypothetical protein
MANPWNTIHIFGFGTVQVISDDDNVQVPFSAVEAEAQAVVDSIWEKRPEDYEGPKTYHAINNFYEVSSDWIPDQRGAKSFRVEKDNLDQALLDALAQAVFNYVPPAPPVE